MNGEHSISPELSLTTQVGFLYLEFLVVCGFSVNYSLFIFPSRSPWKGAMVPGFAPDFDTMQTKDESHDKTESALYEWSELNVVSEYSS